MQITIEPDEMHLIPWEGKANHYFDAIQDFVGVEHVYVFREGQTYDEFMAELAAGRERERLGLPPGRTMPTEEEIAAGPVPEPPPEPDPRDVKIADLEARLAALETVARKK